MGIKIKKQIEVTFHVEQADFLRNCLVHRCGLGIGEVAAKVGVDRATVSKWVNGRLRPQPETIPRLAEVMKCSPEELFRIIYPAIHAVMFPSPIKKQAGQK